MLEILALGHVKVKSVWWSTATYLVVLGRKSGRERPRIRQTFIGIPRSPILSPYLPSHYLLNVHWSMTQLMDLNNAFIRSACDSVISLVLPCIEDQAHNHTSLWENKSLSVLLCKLSSELDMILMSFQIVMVKHAYTCLFLFLGGKMRYFYPLLC